MPDTEITRAETRERARLLRVRSYLVDLDFTRGPETFGSVSLIRFDCHQPGAATHADLIAAGVREIMLNGVPLDPQTTWANGRITLPDLAGRNELRVAADCAYTTSGTGMHRADSGDGSVHIYAKLAQAYARTAYACFDQPDLRGSRSRSPRPPTGPSCPINLRIMPTVPAPAPGLSGSCPPLRYPRSPRRWSRATTTSSRRSMRHRTVSRFPLNWPAAPAWLDISTPTRSSP